VLLVVGLTTIAACSPRLVEVAPTTSTWVPVAPAESTTTTPLPTGEDDPSLAAGLGVERAADPVGVIEVTAQDDVVAIVEGAEEGSYFRFLPGEYRGVVIEPKDGMTFVADPGVTLIGSSLVEGFVAADAGWVAVAPASARTDPVQGEEWGYCDDDRPACVFPEDLFVDDAALIRVISEDEVGPGRWFFDMAAGRIVMGDDPAGHRVELSHAPYAFHGQADGITIAGFTIERYATPGRQGAINPRVGRLDGAGIDWIVADNVIRWSHGWAVKLEDGMAVTGNRLEFNGQGGIGGVAENVVVSGNRVTGNCTAGFRCFGWEGGGMKLHVDDAIVSGNLVDANLGHGIHTDMGCERVVIDSNVVVDNQGAGIHHEISGEAIISGNVVTGNGFAPDRPAEPGILVLSSSDTEVVDNVVDDNALGIVLRQDERVTDGILRDVGVHRNSVRTDTGPAMVLGGSPGDGFQGEWATGIVFDSNNYVFGPNVESPFRWEGIPVDVEAWQAAGNDPGGRFVFSP
jgi:trimeric autotransporter adhesin